MSRGRKPSLWASLFDRQVPERRAGEHEKRIGKHDTAGWPDWYDYIVAEQAGKPLPT